MAKPTIYIETSVVGHLTARPPRDPVVAAQILGTQEWWKKSRDQFDIYTSQVVYEEALCGDPQAAAERIAAIQGVPLVTVTDSARELAKVLVSRNALPAKARIDALHLATAATNALQYLLTWNCRHLANAALRKKIEQVCRELGYNSPVICTPWELPEVNP